METTNSVAQMDTSTENVSVQVSFITSQEQHRVSNVPIAVPVQLRRYGLSEIINHLLGNTVKPIPFDFLINGEFLRTNIAKFLEQKQINKENLLIIEYIESVPPPKPKNDLKHDEWISAVDGGSYRLPVANDYILCGSYDHRLRVWDYSGNCLAVLESHAKPIRAVRWVHNKNDNPPAFAFSASDDETIKLWKWESKANRGTLQCNYVGHTTGVHSLAVSPDADRIASGSCDGSMRMWTASPSSTSTSTSAPVASTKRARLANSKASVETQQSITVFEGHTAEVSSIVWPTPTNVMSGSWDHSIRVWDATNALATTTMSSDKIVTDLSFSEGSQLLASAHDDRCVRLWDPRLQDGVVVKLRLASHMSWVSSVAWSPSSSFLLASASYDHSVKVWDIRAKTALHTLIAHDDKVLCLDWTPRAIISGGADNVLKLMEPPKTEQ